MITSQALLQRLDAIGQSLSHTGKALALLGLGSVGEELDRLDGYSDLDFFAIVQPGCKQAFIENLDWLSSLHPIAYAFKNTPDGYKLLFEDGIFCEFAVFEEQELAEIPFGTGRIVWKHPSIDDAIRIPRKQTIPNIEKTVDWLLGEALTNLYVGLCRWRRGEILSATRFIQGYAVDRIVELSSQIETEEAAHPDPFAHERRYEARFPKIARYLPSFVQGYDRNAASARAILEFLDAHFAINPALKHAILKLCEE